MIRRSPFKWQRAPNCELEKLMEEAKVTHHQCRRRPSIKQRPSEGEAHFHDKTHLCLEIESPQKVLNHTKMLTLNIVPLGEQFLLRLHRSKLVTVRISFRCKD